MNNSKIIRLVLSLALQTTLFCFLANIASGQTTDVSNLTYDEFKKKLEDLGKQGFRPVKIWAKPLGTFDSASVKAGYWAKFEKVRAGIPWAARVGRNAEHYQQEFEKLTAQGLTPMDVNVSCVGSQTLYSGIFEKLPNAPACIARHNIDNAMFQKQNATCTQQGYKLKVKSSCNGVYAAIWQK